jgi:hypothetical protein
MKCTKTDICMVRFVLCLLIFNLELIEMYKDWKLKILITLFGPKSKGISLEM